MKTQMKRFSKSTLSVVLAICMLVSCLTVGIIATDAAKITDNTVGASVEADSSTGYPGLVSGGTSSYYYRGDLNSWGADPMTDAGNGLYYYQASAGNKKFKISESTETREHDASNTTMAGEDGGDTYKITNSNDYNSFWDPASGTHYIIYDSANKKVYWSATQPGSGSGGGTTTDTYTVVGEGDIFGNWDPSNTANDMTLKAGTTNTYTKTFSSLATGSYTIKVVKNHNWNEGSWGSGNDNYDNYNYEFTLNSVCDVTVEYTVDDSSIVVIYDDGSADEWPPAEIGTLKGNEYDNVIYKIGTGSDGITSATTAPSIQMDASDNWWVDFTSVLSLIGNNQLYVGVTKNGDDYKGFYAASVTVDRTDAPGVNGGQQTDKDSKKFAELSGISSDLTHLGILISKDSSNNFTYKVYSSESTATKVYVENGSYGYKSTVGTAAVTSPNSLTYTTGDWWKVYRAEEGDELYVTTTINTAYYSAAENAGWYVYGYAVNGVKYDVKDLGNGKYVNKEPIVVGTTDIEVTPIYYSKAIEANGDYITVYVDATDDLIAHWGNQIHVYSYYYGADTSNTDHQAGRLDGDYPGQSLVLDSSGYYVGKVSKTFYSNNGQTKDADHPVSGVTFSSGVETYNKAHQHFVNFTENRQTYDYDDFVKIAELGYDTVRVELKYTSGTTASNQGLLLSDSTTAGYSAPVNTFNYSTYQASKTTGWEKLYDFDYKECSVLGLNQKYATDSENTWVDASDKRVKIVSVGNQNTSMGTWSTIWYVYDSDNTLITYGLPSDFICRPYESEDGDPAKKNTNAYNLQTTQWKAVVDKGLQFTAADICYEVEMGAGTSTDTANTGHRIDARWLYALSTGISFTVKAGVLYTDIGTTFTRDTNTTAGVTGATAYIDDAEIADYYSSKTFTERNVDATRSTSTASTTYFFKYWATADVDESGNVTNVKKIEGATNPTSNFTASTDQVFYAVYEKVNSDVFVINHKNLKEHDNTTTYTGDGKFYVSAGIYTADGRLVQNYPKSENLRGVPVTNEYADKGYVIKVRLYTVSEDNSTFNAFHVWGNEDHLSGTLTENTVDGFTGHVLSETNPAEYEITINIADLYGGQETLQTNEVTYYSSLGAPSRYLITYIYDSRLYGRQSYVIEGTLNKEDAAAFDSANDRLQRSFVINQAPYEDNFKQTLSFKDSAITFATVEGVYTASLEAKSADDRTVHAYITLPYEYDSTTYAPTEVDANGVATAGTSESFDLSTTYSQHFTVNGNYIEAPAKLNDNDTVKEFSYWELTNNDGAFFAKVYSRQFNYTGYQDYKVTPVYGDGNPKANLNGDNNTTITFLEYSRNQWNKIKGSASWAKADRLYADFVLAFNHDGNLLSTITTDIANVEVGMVIEAVGAWDDDYTTLPATDETKLKTYIISGGTDANSPTGKAQKVVISTNTADEGVKLDNKNMIEFYYGLANSTNEVPTNNKNLEFRAYSYIEYKAADSDTTTVSYSEVPVYFSFHDVAEL